MKCPYVLNEVTTLTRHPPTTIEYEPKNDSIDPALLVGNDESTVTMYVMCDCLEKGCAMWQGNRCIRRA